MRSPDRAVIDPLLERAHQVATLPTIYIEVNAAVEDPETSFSEIGRLIAKDPSLSARLLKIVNSPFYGFSRQIETIPHAVAIIGTAQLRDLVLATTVMDKFRGIPETCVDMQSFWMHSISCGLTARIIATFCRQYNADRFYTLGILHDLGRLVMFMSVPEQMQKAVQRSREEPTRLEEIERELVGCDHHEVGHALLSRWNLSTTFQQAVLHCHHPSRDTNGVASAILHIADLMVHALELGSSGDRFVPPLDVKGWDRLKLTASQVPQIVQQLDRQIEEFGPMML